MKTILHKICTRLILSVLVIAIPLLYVGISYVHQRWLPNDKAPFVYWCGLDPHSEVYVAWETSVGTASFLRYGTDPNHLERTLEASAPATLHRFHVIQLSPDTRYYYQTGSAPGAPDLSSINTFRTAPYESEEFNALFISDTQEVLGIGFYNTVGAAINRITDAAFLANAGDLTQVAEDQASWNLYFHESPYLDHIPLVPCPGNHDAIDSPESLYPKYFGVTENGRDVFYSFEWGSVLFVVAQLGSRGHVDPNTPRNAAPFEWLNDTLAKGQDKMYRVLIYHINNLEVMAPLVEKYNVSLAMHGHAHSYTRSCINRHTYVCLGNGATLQEDLILAKPQLRRKTNGAAFTQLTFNDTGIALKTFTPTMDIMDEVFLRREGDSPLLVPEETTIN